MSAPFAGPARKVHDHSMSTEERRPGYLWAIVQEWMDSIPYPPSQRKLAKRIGVSASAVTDWKYGEGFPEPAALDRLATELGVPYERVLDAVLKDRGYRRPPPPAPPAQERGAS